MESNLIPSCRNVGGGARLSSVFQKTVCLNDWWLIKAKSDSSGKRLAVGGISSKEKVLPCRTFYSAPIVKRYDVFTLETADGICVILNGFVNKKLTSENGFPEEVFKHFVFGFPHNWEDYAVNCFEPEIKCTTAVSENVANPNKLASPKEKIKVESPNSCSMSREKTLGCKSYGIIASKLSVKKHAISTSGLGHHGDEKFKPNRPVNTKHDSDTKIPASLKNTKRKLHFNTPETPRTVQEKGAIISPECLSYGRSRSGRLLMPTLEFWRNQMPVYGADRSLMGIRESIGSTSGSCTGSQSEPPMKPKRQATVARRTKR